MSNLLKKAGPPVRANPYKQFLTAFVHFSFRSLDLRGAQLYDGDEMDWSYGLETVKRKCSIRKKISHSFLPGFEAPLRLDVR